MLFSNNTSFSYECLEDLEINKDLIWPEYDLSFLEKHEINMVIQINGKKRSIIKAKKGISEKELLENLKTDKVLDKYLSKKDIKKLIYIKNKLMNILINE